MKYTLILICFSLLIFALSCQKNNNPVSPDNSTFSFVTPPHFGLRYTIPTDNPMNQDAIELGRMLFYDPILSKDKTISCATCHQQSKAFTDGLPKAVGIRNQSLTRSSMSLVNLLWTDQFFWDGRAKSLEEQAIIPITNPLEMDLPIDQAVSRLQASAIYPPKFKAAFGSEIITSDQIAKALSQFERTLISSNSRFDQIIRGEVKATEDEQRAINLFYTHPIPENNIRGGNCGDCHGSNLTTLNAFHDNGLDTNPSDQGLGAITGRASDRGKMRAPSLRNIALTAPYMHDGRFQTLQEVLDHYNEHIQASPNLDPLITAATNTVGGKSLLLTDQEKKDIILFLNMLTDQDFVTNPKYKSPF